MKFNFRPQQQQTVSLRSPRKRKIWRFSLEEVPIFLIGLAVIVLVFTFCFTILSLFRSKASLKPKAAGRSIERKELALKVNSTGGYQYWRRVAVSLAKLPPDELLKELEAQDPFETRAFESKLLKAEVDKGAFLEFSELVNLFPCPKVSHRITIPDARNHTKAKVFRDNNPQDFSFLFFQHLRKAGGTNFCSLAEKNLPKSAVHNYFCMPDYTWSRNRTGPAKRFCAGCLQFYPNKYISTEMKNSGYRIAGNEWDAFDPQRFFDLSAVFATSFRRPLDRALSQFRFECIESRGCNILNITKWWELEKRLYNVYTWTFTNIPEFGMWKVYISNKPDDGNKRGEILGKALDVVAKFNLVLVMEWLAYASPLVQSTLGFRDTSFLTHRIRPHNQRKRNDGQDVNNLGAAGIGKASWTPETYLSKQQYKVMSEFLALDMILNDAARRMFLERLICEQATGASDARQATPPGRN